jgi:tetratricopeptide (TPR) repeat protein
MRIFRLVAICSLLTCTIPAAHAKMPPVKELIRRGLEECKNAEDADWPMQLLALAQAHLGQHKDAVRTAQAIPSQLWRNTALLECWQIRFEATGVIGELLEGAAESEEERISIAISRYFAAKFLAKAGKLEAAKKFLPKDAGDRWSAFNLADYYLFLAERQAAKGDRKGALASLLEVEKLADHYTGDRFEFGYQTARLCLKLGNREQALKAQKRTSTLLQELLKKSPQQAAFLYARLGRLHALFSETELARQAFEKAILLNKIEPVENDDDDPSAADYRVIDPMLRATEVGIWQLEAGFKKEAAATFRKVIELSKKIKDDGRHDSQLLRFAEKQCETKEFGGALITIAEMRGDYWKALGYCTCAKQNDAKDQERVRRFLLEKAETLADAEPKPLNSTDMFARIAEVHGKLGDLPAAKRCLGKALKISSANKNAHRQNIARSQVRLGLFDDAHETIIGIEPARFQLLPLAELAKEAARTQAKAFKKKSPR